MKKAVFYFFSLFLLMAVSLTASAQKPVVSFGAGGGYGTMKESFTIGVTDNSATGENTDKKGYDLNYTKLLGFADLEFKYAWLTALLEASYAKADYVDYTSNTVEKLLLLDPAGFENASLISAAVYLGYSVFPGRRFQIPILIGAGADYVMGKPIDSIHYSVRFKARAKFYLSNRFGLFGGYSGSYGITQFNNEYNRATEPAASILAATSARESFWTCALIVRTPRRHRRRARTSDCSPR